MSYNLNLQEPLQLGSLVLKNRVIMASLTRNRGITPHSVNVDYYAQRASAGLIISEGILIEPQGLEWIAAPGIWSKGQIEGWKKVTDAVHAKGGLIFAQLWHLGRAANTLHNRGIPPPAPSDIPAKGGKFRLLTGTPGYSVPEPIEDPKEYVNLYKKAAENAKLAGFDGVELLSGFGYLPDQFLESHSNDRTDEYGGSVENRARFILEIIDSLRNVFPSKHVGIKLNPSGGENDMGEESKEKIIELYSYLIKELDSRNIGYIQFIRYFPVLDPENRGIDVDIQEFRPLIKDSLVFANGFFSADDGNKIFNSVPFNEDYNLYAFYNYPEGQPQIGYSDYPAAKA
ncbi:FMN-linked oxidoreductase [Conidiobolus coronatus NRRL 28638]|uniref:FMN-linked oxidoreductase n=1 Tax=Conidiobolus coronatus (strain ATCC 28846 / CBS 209.66 / NRRL 28638) TaxID=796925 RepID=A0A137NXJ9_CONC2|nr:FMN-linked oxidoreductase [Conidiobolus coronatus NRRL 28638]|eukprot:KXN67467.1 FMN-linked oxidoreductase [Conidiobolus coronatus NRRL 28638]